MKELLTGASIVTVLAVCAFIFAVVMQPIFIWIICTRLKRTNELLRRIDSKTAVPAARRP